MRKWFLKYSLLAFSFLFISCSSDVDWTRYFNSEKTTPFGTYVLRGELDEIFHESLINDLNETLYSYFSDNYHHDYDELRYIYINDYLVHDQEAWTELAYFVEHGGTAFISTHSFKDFQIDDLEIELSSFENKPKGPTVSLSVKNKPNKTYKYDKGAGVSYFSKYNHETTTVLGYLESNNEKQPNFIKVNYGDGYFLLHSEPIAFTNYYLLKTDNYTYVSDVFSYIDDGEILWNNKRFQSINESGRNDGGFFNALSFMMKHESLKVALYLLIIMGLLYLLFNSKRRQRIVPIVLPYENYTLDFAKTLAELYRHHPDHKAMVQYKINYFLEQIRVNHNITSKDTEKNFSELLSAKSGVDLSTCQILVANIEDLKTKDKIRQEDFFKLQSLIDTFNKKSKIYGYAKS